MKGGEAGGKGTESQNGLFSLSVASAYAMTVGTIFFNKIVILLRSFVQPWAYRLLRAVFHESFTYSLDLVKLLVSGEQGSLPKTAGSLWAYSTVAHVPSYLQAFKKGI